MKGTATSTAALARAPYVDATTKMLSAQSYSIQPLWLTLLAPINAFTQHLGIHEHWHETVFERGSVDAACGGVSLIDSGEGGETVSGS